MSSPTYKGWDFNIYHDILSELTALHSLHPTVVKSPNISLPFQRPCRSVCDNVNAACLGILELIGLPQNCSTRMDYSRGTLAAPIYEAFPTLPLPFKYDASNDIHKCNSMEADVLVASSNEMYLKADDPSGACYGITTELYVPPANSLSSAFAPMQGPYVVQSMLEMQLSSSLNNLPVFLSSECHLAIKKYFCSSYMLSPSQQSIAKAFETSLPEALLSTLFASGELHADFFSYSATLPSYPHHAVCQEYASACADFITLSKVPQLMAQCDIVIDNIQRYPSANQTVETLPISVGGVSAIVNFQTPPNTLQHVTVDFTTLCPDGYVVPDKYDKRTIWIPGSGCALSCRPHMITNEEFHNIEILSYVMAWIGLPMVIFLLVTWIMDTEKRKQYLVICFGLMSLVPTTIVASSPFLAFKKKFCATNAVSFDKTDGVTFCSVEIGATDYANVGMTTSWFLLAFDLFLKVVMNVRNTSQYRVYFILLVVFLPVPFASYSFTTNFRVYPTFPFCLPQPDDDLIAATYVLAILTSSGVVLMAMVNLRIIQSLRRTANSVSTSGQESPLARYKVLRTPIIFSICFVTLVACYMSFRFHLTLKFRNRVNDSYAEFTECIFTHFDGTDESWERVCGSHPSYRESLGWYSLAATVICGQSVLISIIYLSQPSVWSYWGIRPPNCLGFKNLLFKKKIKTNVIQVSADLNLGQQGLVPI